MGMFGEPPSSLTWMGSGPGWDTEAWGGRGTVGHGLLAAVPTSLDKRAAAWGPGNLLFVVLRLILSCWRCERGNLLSWGHPGHHPWPVPTRCRYPHPITTVRTVSSHTPGGNPYVDQSGSQRQEHCRSTWMECLPIVFHPVEQTVVVLLKPGTFLHLGVFFHYKSHRMHPQ